MSKYNEDDWCSYTGHITIPRGEKPGKIRCPKCRKRMMPQTLDSEPFGAHFDPYYIIPRHKKPHGKRR